jgi:GAF domain-containing protein
VAAASPSSAGAYPIAEVLEGTARALVDALDVAACAISRVVGDLLVDIVGYSRDRERLFLGYGYLISEYPLTREVLELRVARSLTVFDENVDEREAAILRELGYQSLLMLPLVCDAKAWALVEVYAIGRRKFGPRDLAVAEQIVADTGVELERLSA